MRITTLYALLATFMIGLPAPGRAAAQASPEAEPVGLVSARAMQPLDAKYLLKGSKYHYFSEYLCLKFDLKRRSDVESFVGILLQIDSNDGQSEMLILDWDDRNNLLELICLRGDAMEKSVIPNFVWPESGQVLPVSLTLNFRNNSVLLDMGTQSLRLNNLNLSIDKGYRFSLLPALSVRPDANIPGLLDISNLELDMPPMPAKRRTWWWFVAIIAVDLGIYIAMKRRRRKTAVKSETPESGLQLTENLRESFAIEELPRVSAIYLFGGFCVYDANGDDITKQFSPMLKELLCLLIVHSAENGISSHMLKEVLWYDKETKNASNNRAVYLGKLRAILNAMGNCTLSNETGYWKLTTEGIFIDYFEYKKLELDTPPKQKQIEALLYIIQHGNLMPNVTYSWLDAYKASVADVVIEQLSGYSRTLSIESAPDLSIAIADIISQFDQLDEHALYLKCKAYNSSGRHASAKNAYDVFAQKYREIYGENLAYGFADLLNQEPGDEKNT